MKDNCLSFLRSFLLGLHTFYKEAQNDSNDLAEQNLRGKIKSVNTNTYAGVEKFGEMKKGPRTEWE